MAIYLRNEVWHYRFVINGVRYRGSCKTGDEKLAQEYEDNLKADAWRRKHLKHSVRHTWAEALDRWLKDHAHKRTALSDVQFGRWWTEQFAAARVRFLDEVTPDVVMAIRDAEIGRPRQRNGKPIAPATVNRKIAMLRSVINAAAREYQWIEQAPLFRCLPERNERVRFLTVPELQRLIGALEEPYRSMATVAVSTGLRFGNIARLTWEQVDFVRRVMTFPATVMKNGLPLTIPINDTAMSAIRSWLGRHDLYVFVRSDGQAVKQIPSKMWARTLREAGIENFRWHDLRHTWASLMRQSGQGLDVIQELGAWQDSRMVKRYAHLSVEHLLSHSKTIDSLLPGGVAQNGHKNSHTLVAC
jgi:integrase